MRTVREMGWLGMRNGELVLKAYEAFDTLFTIDRNMVHQTSLKGLNLAVLVAHEHFSDIKSYPPVIQEFESIRSTLVKGSYTLLGLTQ